MLAVVFEWLALAAAVAMLIKLLFRAQASPVARGADSGTSTWRAEYTARCAAILQQESSSSGELVLDLSAVELPNIPDDIATLCPSITGIKFKSSRGMGSLAALGQLPQLQHVVITGAALTKTALSEIRALPRVHTLDFRACQTVVDVKNAASGGLCVPADLWQLSWQARHVRALLLPIGGAYEVSICIVMKLYHMIACAQVGEVVKGFPKVGVVVIALRHALRLGDSIQFVRSDSAAPGMHEWRSKPTTLRSIRNDAHVGDCVPT